jgi:hypothetical protein
MKPGDLLSIGWNPYLLGDVAGIATLNPFTSSIEIMVSGRVLIKHSEFLRAKEAGDRSLYLVEGPDGQGICEVMLITSYKNPQL